MTISVSRNGLRSALLLICVVGAVGRADADRNGYFGVYSPVGGNVVVSTLLAMMSGVFASKQ